jgi:hypothetical protein
MPLSLDPVVAIALHFWCASSLYVSSWLFLKSIRLVSSSSIGVQVPEKIGVVDLADMGSGGPW